MSVPTPLLTQLTLTGVQHQCELQVALDLAEVGWLASCFTPLVLIGEQRQRALREK